MSELAGQVCIEVRLTGFEREVLGYVVAGKDPWKQYGPGYGRFVSQAIGRLKKKHCLENKRYAPPTPTEFGRSCVISPHSPPASAGHQRG